MNTPNLENESLPGLYQAADQASIKAQANYFLSLEIYLVLLVSAAIVSFLWPQNVYGAAASAALFLITLMILVSLRVNRPDGLWYNGRAVAESVKTRAWRWAMRAEPYEDANNVDIVIGKFLADLKEILDQNRSLSRILSPNAGIQEPISEAMTQVRKLPVSERLAIYQRHRVKDQADWYARKAQFNQACATTWFWISVLLHSAAIVLLLYRMLNPAANPPIETIATAAGAALTWLQAKKFNELSSSYSLAALEIGVIQGRSRSVRTEQDLSHFVLSSESAFSREHTQWAARKAE